MKRIYTRPEFEAFPLETLDIIAASVLKALGEIFDGKDSNDPAVNDTINF